MRRDETSVIIRETQWDYGDINTGIRTGSMGDVASKGVRDSLEMLIDCTPMHTEMKPNKRKSISKACLV